MRGTLGIHPPNLKSEHLGPLALLKALRDRVPCEGCREGTSPCRGSQSSIYQLARRTWSADSVDVTEEYRSVILVSLPRRDKELFSLSDKCCVFRVTRLLQTDCFSSSRKYFSIVLMLEGFSGVWRDKCHAPSAC